MVQVHEDKVGIAAFDHTCRLLAKFGESSPFVANHSSSFGVDRGRYCNVSYSTDHPRALWRQLRDRVLLQNPLLAQGVIVSCEGTQGWRDYLLLHHFDPNEEVDDF